MKQKNYNEMNQKKNKQQQHQKQQTIKFVIFLDKSKDNIKQINIQIE